MIKKLFNRIFSKLAKLTTVKPRTVTKELSSHSSTILQPALSVLFHTKKEDRLYVKIGQKGIINSQFIFETEKGRVEIGDNVHIGAATFICRTSITVKNNVTMAWGITIYDHDSHSTNWEHRKNDNHRCYDDYLNHNGNNIINKDWTNVNAKPIVIESNVWIGFDVLILKGVTVGEGAVIGAKSVVTKNVPPYTLVAGNPARIIKQLSKNNV